MDLFILTEFFKLFGNSTRIHAPAYGAGYLRQ